MTKSNLVEAVLNDPEIRKIRISKPEGSVIISALLEKLKSYLLELSAGDRIELRGFGTFGVRQRQPRIARNPKTGERFKIPSRKYIYFKAGSELKKNV